MTRCGVSLAITALVVNDEMASTVIPSCVTDQVNQIHCSVVLGNMYLSGITFALASMATLFMNTFITCSDSDKCT